MAIGFEQDGWPQVQPQRRKRQDAGIGDSRVSPAGDWPACDTPACDWHGLRSRLAAAHAFRRTLAETPALWMRAEGSFDACAARAMKDYGQGYGELAYLAGQGGVNRTGLADGKAPADNLAQVADAPARGDRGY